MLSRPGFIGARAIFETVVASCAVLVFRWPGTGYRHSSAIFSVSYPRSASEFNGELFVRQRAGAGSRSISIVQSRRHRVKSRLKTFKPGAKP